MSASESSQGVRSFALDPSGNRTSTTINGGAYSYGVDSGSNRLSTSTAPSSAASYQYDAAGQIISDGARTFTWTKAGYLASAATGQGYAGYSYNGFGQRVKKVTVSGGQASAKHYLYAEDGVSLLGEYSQSSAAAPVGSLYEVVYLKGIPVLVLAGGQTFFIQSDHLNTPRTIKNAAGAVVWRWESDAFGIGAANQNPGGVMQFEFNLRLPGQQFDAETGLHYNNARFYDPGTGRYISSDPIGLRGGINTYGYVMGNPLSWSDPTGLMTYVCKRPLGGEPGSYAPPLLNHTYVCVGSGANMTCGSTTASSGGALSNIFGNSPGKPTTPITDYYKPEACEMRQGEDSCIETCIANELKKPIRPKYGVGPSGTDCQEYSEDVVSTCEKRCVRR